MAKMKKRTKIILIVVAIVVIATIGAGIWYWQKKKAANNQSDDQPDNTAEIEPGESDKKKVMEESPETDTTDFDLNDIENRIRKNQQKTVAEEVLDPEIKVTVEQTELKKAKVAQENLKKSKIQG